MYGSIRGSEIRLGKVQILLLAVMIALLFTGCQRNTKPEKVADVDYTVAEEGDIPQELLDLIEDKKESEFCLTYTDGDDMYLTVGYGKQETGGYSISVTDLYLTEDSIYINTELLGPSAEEEISQVATYPWIVVKMETMDRTIFFD